MNKSSNNNKFLGIVLETFLNVLILYVVLIKNSTENPHLLLKSILVYLSVEYLSYYLTLKYRHINKNAYYTYFITPLIKYYSVSLVLIFTIWLIFHSSVLPIELFVSMLALKLIAEFSLFTFVFVFNKNLKPLNKNKLLEINSTNSQMKLNYNTNNTCVPNIESFISEIGVYENRLSKLIYKNLDSLFSNTKSVKTYTYFERLDSVIKKDSQDLVVIEKQINYYKNLPHLMSSLYEVVKPGGVIVFSFVEQSEIEKKILQSNSSLLGKIKLLQYIIKYRVIPKLPILANLHSISKSFRSISKVEMDGRLLFQGFKTERMIRVNSSYFCIARKTYTPVKNAIPSYKYIVGLNRVGYKGEIIRIYKIRSMYPYSEFLQQKVYKNNELSITGKFQNDYRITKYGAFLRKYWIDELPQILNWMRSDIKLVGIRAMSIHYFGLYPEFYKKLYIAVKPGLIPPLFDEANDGFEKIVQIEMEYLESYRKNRFLTDFNLLLNSLNRIFKDKLRSS